MPRILLIALLLMLMQSCAGRSRSPQPAATPAPPAPVFDLPLPVDAPRESAMTVYLSVSGDNPHAYSGDPLMSEGALEMTAAAGELEYAIYRLSTSGHPLETVEVNLSVMGGEGCWLAIANYVRGSWDISGPHSGGTLVNSDPEQDWVSPGNNLFVAVLAYNSTTVSVTRVLAGVEFPFWQKHVIEADGNCAGGSSLAELNGRPAVSYHHETLGVLRFAYADTAAPLTNDWVIMTADEGNEGMEVVGRTSLAIIDGKPLIAHAGVSPKALRIAATDLAEPAEDTDWTSYELDQLSWQPTGCISLAGIDGLPAVAYVQYEPDYRVRYAFASQAVPALEHWTLTDGYSPQEPFRHLSLADIGGYPAAAFYISGDTVGLGYSACDSNPPASPADWLTHTITDDGNPGDGCALLSLDGRPAIGYINPSLLYVAFASADSALPQDPQAWSSHHLADGIYASHYAAMALVAERPCIAYYVAAGEEVWCAWAKTTAPAVPSDWAITLVDWGLGTSGGHVSVADIGGLPALTYYDEANGDVKYARQVTP